MPDITMCDGIVHPESKASDCPLRKECYRYRAYPSEFRQSMFVIAPFDEDDEDCEHFWSIKGQSEANLTGKN